MSKHKQNGFGLLTVILGITVITLVGFAAFRLTKAKQPLDVQNSNVSTQTSQNAKEASNNACSTKPVLPLPTDITKVQSILYPGQVRGGNYKPHGGFRFSGSTNSINVSMPVSAKLISGSRYIEAGEVQYLFEFEADCKIHFRFDHLATLSSAMQAEADKLPEAKVDDSRTTNLGGVRFNAGDIIATKVGYLKTANVSFDYGLYDYSTKNESSKNASWATLHPSDNEQYGVCWFDYLSHSDKATVLALPATDQQAGKTSDYCK